MSDDWYVRLAEQTHGPLSEEQLRKALAAGRITTKTAVRKGIIGGWITAGAALAKPVPRSALSPPTSVPPTLPAANLAAPTKSRTPLVLAACGVLAILVVGLWVSFEIGRRHTAQLAAQTPPSDEPKVNAAPPAEPEAVRPAPRIAQLQPSVDRQSVVAQRPRQAEPKIVAPAMITQTDRPNPQAFGESLGPPSPKVPTETKQPPNANKNPIVAIAKVIPVVVPRAQAKDADVRGLETAANHASTSKEALALYKHFGATRTMSAEQQAKFNTALQVWEDRAKQDLVRLGDKWVAEAEALKAHEHAAQLFREAFEMIKILNFAEARKTLERASRVDPNSIAADFTLGILNSITSPDIRSPKIAEKHFLAVLRRMPGYVPALNNLAIAEIRLEKYGEALRHLREAADRAPTSEEVTQNLGRFVSEANLKRIRPRKTVLADATKLYSKVVTTKEGTASELKFGWRYIPLVSPKGERESLASVQTSSNSESFVAQGTGFVVEPHYVLTCRHVVDDVMLGRADKIELIDPADPKHQRRFSAACVDVAKDDDLALLRCDQLDAPSISLSNLVPPRGTEVVLIGFPGGSWFGLGLKTTRGVVTALPGDVARIGGPNWFDFSRRLWYDAASSHGASGGAVCDDHGSVVAIHAVGYQPGDDPSNAKYAGGVPAPYAAEFIKTVLPAFAHPPAVGPSLKWTEVDAKISPSVVLIVVGHRKVAMVMNDGNGTRAGRGHGSHYGHDIYDDHVCSACNGKGRMRCRAPGCVNGVIHGETTYDDPMIMNGAKTQIVVPHQTTVSTRHPCPQCGGKGYVHCSYCTGGVDPTLN
jgi:S1-C subfamily serine protease